MYIWLIAVYDEVLGCIYLVFYKGRCKYCIVLRVKHLYYFWVADCVAG